MGQLCIFLNISKFPLENIFFGKYSISRLLFQCFTKTKKRCFMKKFLLLLCLAAVFPLLAYPLVPGKRYRADFEMKTIHPAYPEDWYCQNLKFNYPGVSFRFANSKGKELRRLNFKSPYYMSFFNNFNKESFEFYAPDNAAKLVLRKSGVIIRNFKLTEVTPGENIALPLNHRVAGQLRNAEITLTANGKAIFDTSINGVVESMPVRVEGGQRYRLTITGGKGTRNGKGSSLLIRYYFYKASTGKSISSNKEAIRTSNPNKPMKYEFRAPKDAKWFTIWCMWAKLYDFKLEKI